MSELFDRWSDAGTKLVTTDYVLGETITLLHRRIAHADSVQFVEEILDNVDAGRFELVYINAERFARAWELRRRLHDKPRISFADLSSMVVMQECGITQVVTADEHFTHVGLGFEKMP